MTRPDHVHAHLAAIVTASEPVPPGVAEEGVTAGPGNPVALALERKVPSCKRLLLF